MSPFEERVWIGDHLEVRRQRQLFRHKYTIHSRYFDYATFEGNFGFEVDAIVYAIELEELMERELDSLRSG